MKEEVFFMQNIDPNSVVCADKGKCARKLFEITLLKGRTQANGQSSEKTETECCMTRDSGRKEKELIRGDAGE